MNLTEKEQQCLSALVNAALMPHFDSAQLESLINTQLKNVIPHALLIAGVGKKELNRINILDFLLVGNDAELFKQSIINRTSTQERPLIALWLTGQQPLYVTEHSHVDTMSAFERDEMLQFNLQPMLIHGQRDIAGKMTSYINLSQCSLEETRACWLMRLYTPYLHTLLLKVLNIKTDFSHNANIQLTDIEWQLLEFLNKGLGNKEIARRLNKSPSTIKHQVTALFAKRDVDSRTEAVAVYQQLT